MQCADLIVTGVKMGPFRYSVRSMSSEHSSSSEQPSEKVPLVPLAIKFDSLARLFQRSLTFENGNGGSGASTTTTSTAGGVLGGSRDSDLSNSSGR